MGFGSEVVDAEQPVQPCRSAAERDGERLHGDAIVDDGSACFCEEASFGSTDSSCPFAGSRCLRTRFIQSPELGDLGLGGRSALGQTRIAGCRHSLHVLEGGADRLAGAAQILGDAAERLSFVAAADDFVDVRDRAPAPASVGDVVARDCKATDVLAGHAMTLGDLLPALTGPVARGGVGGDLIALRWGELYSPRLPPGLVGHPMSVRAHEWRRPRTADGPTWDT